MTQEPLSLLILNPEDGSAILCAMGTKSYQVTTNEPVRAVGLLIATGDESHATGVNITDISVRRANTEGGFIRLTAAHNPVAYPIFSEANLCGLNPGDCLQITVQNSRAFSREVHCAVNVQARVEPLLGPPNTELINHLFGTIEERTNLLEEVMNAITDLRMEGFCGKGKADPGTCDCHWCTLFNLRNCIKDLFKCDDVDY
jgi:hypothetical protein